jgi:hypothetical protein
MGIEKLEPTVPRKDVDRRIHVLRKEQIRNTALRFRFQMLLQRYNTYQTHWQRICRDIENGTYKRHVIRAQRRFGMQPVAAGPRVAAGAGPRSFADELAALNREFAPAETLSDADVDLEEEAPTTPNRPPSSSRVAAASGPASSRGTPPRSPRSPPPRPPRPPPARTPRPPKPDSRPAPASSRPAAAPPSSRPAASPPSSRPVASPPRAVGSPPVRRPNVAVRPAPGSGPLDGSDLPEERVRQLYSLYIEAKRRQNESTAAITYEAVARTIRASSAKLRQKLGKPVDFEIAVKDGHAIIRPVVK